MADGYSEVMTYTFCNKGDVEVLASASDKTRLRTNLADGLKASYQLNKNNMALLGMNEIKIFEIGTVFSKNNEQINVATADKKGITEKSLEEFISQMPHFESTNISLLGNFSAHASRIAQDFQNEASGSVFKQWSQFPFISRDIAVWVESGVESNQVHKVIKDNVGELVVRGPELFDTFSKENKTSYAFRMVFQSYERTLEDGEVNTIMDTIYSKIKENGWEIR